MKITLSDNVKNQMILANGKGLPKYECLVCGIVRKCHITTVFDYQNDEIFDEYTCPYCNGFVLEIYENQ